MKESNLQWALQHLSRAIGECEHTGRMGSEEQHLLNKAYLDMRRAVEACADRAKLQQPKIYDIEGMEMNDMQHELYQKALAWYGDNDHATPEAVVMSVYELLDEVVEAERAHEDL